MGRGGGHLSKVTYSYFISLNDGQLWIDFDTRRLQISSLYTFVNEDAQCHSGEGNCGLVTYNTECCWALP